MRKTWEINRQWGRNQGLDNQGWNQSVQSSRNAIVSLRRGCPTLENTHTLKMAHAFCVDPLFWLTSPVFGGCGGSFSFGQANVYVGETTIISQTKLRTFSVVANYIFLLSYSLEVFRPVLSLQLYFESFVCCIKTERPTGRTGGSNGISEIVNETNQISSCLTIIDVVDPIKNIPFGDGFLPPIYGNLGDGLWQDGLLHWVYHIEAGVRLAECGSFWSASAEAMGIGVSVFP